MDAMDTPPLHSRSSNGTPLFARQCAQCGAVAIVDRRRLGKPCPPCAMRARRTHGFSAGGKLHPIYALLNSLKARCHSPSATHYAYYGGRGISVCREWRDDPAAFVAWATANGWRRGLALDRIDADGDYRPENCRFITPQENGQRTRRIKTTIEQAAHAKRLLTEGHSVQAVADAVGVSYMIVWHISKKNSWSNA